MSRICACLAAIALTSMLAVADPASAAELLSGGLRADPAQTEPTAMRCHWCRRHVVVYRRFWGPRYGSYPWVPRYAYYPYWRPY